MFDVLSPVSIESNVGRELTAGYEKSGKIKAVLACARPEDKQRWSQLQHQITHKIIADYVPDFVISPGDVFVYRQKCFFLQTTPYNPGGLNHFVIYYCQEKCDIESAPPVSFDDN